jgi:hypothetical protein
MFSLVLFGVLYYVLVSRLHYLGNIFITGVCLVCSYDFLLTCNYCEFEAFEGCLGLNLETSLPMYLPVEFTLAEVVDVVQPLVVLLP